MNKYLTKNLLLDIADEMGVNPAFIEKDFYATKVLEKMAQFSCLGHQVIFSGGTSLSKGYALIHRFSEDLDFNIYNSTLITQGQRKTIRTSFREIISQIPDLKIESIQTANAGKKETILVSYPKIFKNPNHLRDFLRVELFFDSENNTNFEEREITSFIDAYGAQSNAFLIKCNAPFNIMADKFNALVWRIYKNNENIDYTLMRHLHDIYALNAIIKIDNKLKNRIITNFETKDRLRIRADISFNKIIKITQNKLSSLKSYEKGYHQFVNSMSYAKDDEQITFVQALTVFDEIAQLFV